MTSNTSDSLGTGCVIYKFIKFLDNSARPYPEAEARIRRSVLSLGNGRTEPMGLTFRLVKVLSGHDCFGKYLCHIEREHTLCAQPGTPWPSHRGRNCRFQRRSNQCWIAIGRERGWYSSLNGWRRFPSGSCGAGREITTHLPICKRTQVAVPKGIRRPWCRGSEAVRAVVLLLCSIKKGPYTEGQCRQDCGRGRERSRSSDTRHRDRTPWGCSWLEPNITSLFWLVTSSWNYKAI